MAEAPAGDEPLTPDTAVDVLDEILEAQNQSYVLGLKLKLPLHVVDGIYEKYSDPRNRLLQVLIEFTKQVDPRPTWRAIVAALRSPAVNLPKLAATVEAAHCPKTCNATPSTASTSTELSSTQNSGSELMVPPAKRMEIDTSRTASPVASVHDQPPVTSAATGLDTAGTLRYSGGDVTSDTAQDRTICQLASYTCHVSCPNLQSATANHPKRVIVELTDSSNKPCSVPQNVTAQLELITPTSSSRELPVVNAAVATTSPSRYEVSYTAISRGQHKLHVRLNDIEINGSPFTTTVYPDPTRLPVRVVTDLKFPYGIAVNSRGEMIVSERGSHQIAIFDIRGQRIRKFGTHGDSAEQMEYPAGIAIDNVDNIYVSSIHKLQKFTSSGELITCVGRKGSKEGEFNEPRGLALHNNQVYVCDRDNHRIQVFDLDLNFIQSIGSRGKGKGEFKAPFDVKFDTAGHMYVAEFDNCRVQVIDRNGQFQMLGENGLCKPSGLHIVDKYIYVSDYKGDRIVVYETSGQFFTSFGRRGPNKGKFWVPYGITSCLDGYIYVCDYKNDRVQIF